MTNVGIAAETLEVYCLEPAHTNHSSVAQPIQLPWTTLSAGEVVTMVYSTRIDVPIPPDTLIENSCWVENYTPKPSSGIVSITATTATTVNSFVDLSTSEIIANRVTVTPGQRITYTIDITNSGTLTATEPVFFAGRIPTHTVLAAYPTGCSPQNHDIRCNFADLAVGMHQRYIFAVTVTHVLTNGYPIVFTGIFNALNAMTAHPATATVTVTSQSQLYMRAYGPGSPRQICYPFNHTIYVDNLLGNANSTNTILTATIDVPVGIALSVRNYDHWFPLTNTMVVSLETISPPGAFSVRNIVTRTWAQIYLSITNTALITDGTPLVAQFELGSEAQTQTLKSTITTTVRSLCISKSDDPYNWVAVDGTLNYYITVRNRDLRLLENVTLHDALPSRVSFGSSAPTCGVDILSSCSLGDMSPFDVHTEQVAVTVLKPLESRGLYNEACAQANNAGPVCAGAWTLTYGPDFSESWMRVVPVETIADHLVEELITYTLYLRNGYGRWNDAIVAATDVYASISIPNGMVVDECSDGTLTGEWIVPYLGVGETKELYCRFKVLNPLANGTVLTSTATIYNDQRPFTITKHATATVYARPYFDFTKTVIPTAREIPLSTVLTYTIRITNTGDENATGVVVTDIIPTGTSFVAASGGISPIDRVLTWPTFNLSVRDPAHVFTFSVMTTQPNIANRAFVTSDQTRPYWHPSTVASNAALEIRKVAAASTVQAGKEISFTIVVTAYSNLTGVQIYEYLPLSTTLRSTFPSVPSTNPLMWEVGALEAGASASATFTVEVKSPQTNGALLWNDHYEVACAECAAPIPGDPVEVTILSREGLEVELIASPMPTIPVGVPADYWLVVSNDGNRNANHVYITYTLPLSLNDLRCLGGATIGNTCLWQDVAVSAGSVYTAHVQATPMLTVPNLTKLVHNLYGAFGNSGPALTSGPLTQTIVAPVLTWAWTIAPDLVIPGQGITYTLSVTNIGDYAAENLNVTHDFPNEVTQSHWDGGVLSLDAHTSHNWRAWGIVSWPLPDDYLLTHTFTLSATNIITSQLITATGVVTNLPNLKTSVLRLADMYVMPVTGTTDYDLVLTYTVHLTNTGSTTSTHTRVVFNAPANTEYVVGSVKGPSDWPPITPTPDGFIAMGGNIPVQESRIITFALWTGELLHHTTATPLYKLIYVQPQLIVSADRHLPLTLTNNLDIRDTSYRPDWCALASPNISATTNYTIFERIFYMSESYGLDARRVYTELFATAPQGGICDGLSMLSGRHFSGEGNQHSEFGTTVGAMCTLGDRPELISTAIAWQGTQIASNFMWARFGHTVDTTEFIAILTSLLASSNGLTWKGNSIVLGLEQYMEDCSGKYKPVAHSVFPYRIEFNDNWVYIYVYDPNYPITITDTSDVLNHYIRVNTITREWQYDTIDAKNDASGQPTTWRGDYFRYMHLADYRNVLYLPTDFGSEGVLVNGLRMSGPTSHDTGESIVCEDGQLKLGIKGAYRFRTAAGNGQDRETFLLPEGRYTITPTRVGGENYLSVYQPGHSLGETSAISMLAVTVSPDSFSLTRVDHEVTPPSGSAITATVYKHGSDSDNLEDYTSAYTVTGTPLVTQSTLTLTAIPPNEKENLVQVRALLSPHQGTPTPAQLKADQFEMILAAPSGEAFHYVLSTSWNSINHASESITFQPMTINPGDRHVLFVYDRYYMKNSVICIDVGNNGDFESCVEMAAVANPPALSYSELGEVVEGQTITYTTLFTNTSDVSQTTGLYVHTPIPTLTHYISGSMSCSPEPCAPYYVPGDTPEIGLYYTGLPAKMPISLTFAVQVMAICNENDRRDCGKKLPFAPWGQSDLLHIPPLYATPLQHIVVENRKPYQPAYITPLNNASQVTLTSDLVWRDGDPDVNDIVTYSVVLRGCGAAAYSVCTQTTTTIAQPATFEVITWAMPGLLTATRYTWVVTPTDNHTNYRNGTVWRFTTFNQTPYTPSLLMPTITTNLPLTPSLVWQVGDPDNTFVTYTIQFGANPPTVIVTNSRVITYTPYILPDSLHPHTTYSWQITAFDGLDSATASGALTTWNHPPSVPTSLAPCNMMQVPITQTLTWNNSLDPDPYETLRYVVSLLPGYIPRTVPEPIYTPTIPLEYSKHYTWTLVATDGFSSSLPVTCTFMTVHGITPTEVIPPDGDTNVPLTQTLGWNLDPHPLPVTFTVAFGPTGSVTTVVPSTTGFVYDPGHLAPHTTYCWVITSTDLVITSTTTGCFTTLNNAPHKPEYHAPGSNATNVSLTPTFIWTGGDPDGMYEPTMVYTIVLSPDDVGVITYPVTQVSATQRLTYTLPRPLDSDTTYTWHIIAGDTVSSTQGNASSFTTTDVVTPVLCVASQSFAFTMIEGRENPGSQNLAVNNCGSGVLQWQAQASSSGSLTAARVTLAPETGTAPSSLTISVNGNGLPVGIYSGTVIITGVTVGNGAHTQQTPQVVTVTLTVRSGKLYLPLVVRVYTAPSPPTLNPM